MSKTHELAIIGPLPPPHGGISIHVQRLLAHLEACGVDTIVYNTGGPTAEPGRVVSVAHDRQRWFARYVLTGREPVVFIHTATWQVWAASLVLSRVRRRRVVLTFHGASILRALESASPLRRRILLLALRSATHLVAVNQTIARGLRDAGIPAASVTVAPAFIPPPDTDRAPPPDVLAFCERHDPVLLGSGGALHLDGVDLYGIDMTLELIGRLRERHPRVGLVWILMKIIGFEPDYEEHLRREVARRGLTDHVLFVEPRGELYPLLPHVDLLVRPTASDGDALTIREAHALGVPTVVSDAAPRPSACTVFRSRDPDAFLHAVSRVLDDPDEARARARSAPLESGLAPVLAILEGALGRPTKAV